MEWVRCNSIREVFMKENLRQAKKMETGYKSMTMANIIKANGKTDTNMDKDTYSSAMEVTAVGISWITSFTAMLSTAGPDKRNIGEIGLLTNRKDKE